MSGIVVDYDMARFSLTVRAPAAKVHRINLETVHSWDGQRLFQETCAMLKSQLEDLEFYDVEYQRIGKVMLVEINFNEFYSTIADQKGQSIALIVVWILDPYAADSQRDGQHLLLNCLQKHVPTIRAACTPYSPESIDQARGIIPWKGPGHEAANADESWKQNADLRKPGPPHRRDDADDAAAPKKKKKKNHTTKQSNKDDRDTSDEDEDEDEEEVEYQPQKGSKPLFGATYDQTPYEQLKNFLSSIPVGSVTSPNGQWLVNQLQAMANAPTDRRHATLQGSIAAQLETYISVKNCLMLFSELGCSLPAVGVKRHEQVAESFLLFVKARTTTAANRVV
jgi:hypothetical protein